MPIGNLGAYPFYWLEEFLHFVGTPFTNAASPIIAEALLAAIIRLLLAIPVVSYLERSRRKAILSKGIKGELDKLDLDRKAHNERTMRAFQKLRINPLTTKVYGIVLFCAQIAIPITLQNSLNHSRDPTAIIIESARPAALIYGQPSWRIIILFAVPQIVTINWMLESQFRCSQIKQLGTFDRYIWSFLSVTIGMIALQAFIGPVPIVLTYGVFAAIAALVHLVIIRPSFRGASRNQKDRRILLLLASITGLSAPSGTLQRQSPSKHPRRRSAPQVSLTAVLTKKPPSLGPQSASPSPRNRTQAPTNRLSESLSNVHRPVSEQDAFKAALEAVVIARRSLWIQLAGLILATIAIYVSIALAEKFPPF